MHLHAGLESQISGEGPLAQPLASPSKQFAGVFGLGVTVFVAATPGGFTGAPGRSAACSGPTLGSSHTNLEKCVCEKREQTIPVTSTPTTVSHHHKLRLIHTSPQHLCISIFPAFNHELPRRNGLRNTVVLAVRHRNPLHSV